MSEILTIEETADYLKMKVAQVYDLGRRKENPLPIIKITRHTQRVNKEALDAWLTTNNTIK